MKRKDSFAGSFAISIAGIMAPNRFPRCGVPVLCTPVSILIYNVRVGGYLLVQPNLRLYGSIYSYLS